MIISKKMNEIVVSLVTYYPKESIRRNLAIKSIKELTKHYEVIVVDGGSDSEFLDEIKTLGAKVYPQETKGLREAKRQSYRKAYETEKAIIICMEPEKFDFIKSIPDLVSELKTKNLDIIYPGRKAFQKCPTFQTYTEQAGNLFFGDYLNLYWDYFFGPIIWKRDCSNYFLDFKEKVPEASWDIHIIGPIIAKKDGKKVEQLKIDFTYEKEMMQEEEKSIIFNQKRINQLNSLTQTIQLYPELKFN